MIGGGNSGVEVAIDLARIAGHVTVLELADRLEADAVWHMKQRAPVPEDGRVTFGEAKRAAYTVSPLFAAVPVNQDTMPPDGGSAGMAGEASRSPPA